MAGKVPRFGSWGRYRRAGGPGKATALPPMFLESPTRKIVLPHAFTCYPFRLYLIHLLYSFNARFLCNAESIESSNLMRAHTAHNGGWYLSTLRLVVCSNQGYRTLGTKRPTGGWTPHGDTIHATEGREKVRHHSDGNLIMHPPMRTLVCQTILSLPPTYAGVLLSSRSLVKLLS